ncbi:MAG: hypothetical protein RID09_25935 [Coleofasciculus sp. G1-WW12-02]|uniref:hypothetical protein n=1 Tax=Coleofasciculus sp. G1-WW12-02 TaxID=3068483 RepID=UPI0032F18654
MALEETCDRAVCSSLFVVATLVAVCALSQQPVNPYCSNFKRGRQIVCDRVSQQRII